MLAKEQRQGHEFIQQGEYTDDEWLGHKEKMQDTWTQEL